MHFELKYQKYHQLIKIDICMYFVRKIPKVELHPSKTFFWWPSSTFDILFCKISVAFDFDQDILSL